MAFAWIGGDIRAGARCRECEQLVFAFDGRAFRTSDAATWRPDAGERERGPILARREMLQLPAWTGEMRLTQKRIVTLVAATSIASIPSLTRA